MDDATFRTFFRKSPIKRSGRERFLRNCLIALGNSGDADQTTIAAIEAMLADPSPTIRGAAVWALAELLPAEKFETARTRWFEAEADEEVRAEWNESGERPEGQQR